jgi:hypothetical protein
LGTQYPDSFKDKVKRHYAEVGLTAYDESDSTDTAMVRAGHSVSDTFTKPQSDESLPSSTHREWTKQFRSNGTFDPESAKTYLSSHAFTGDDSRDEQDFNYDRVNFDEDDLGSLEDYIVTDYDEYVDYDEEKDVYRTFVPEYGTIKLPGEIHRAVKADYSEWVGDGDTISKITRKYPFFDEYIFKKYKKIHQWTHQSSPFTKEEFQERELGDLQADLEKLREHELWKRDQEKQIRENERKAEKYDKTLKGLINPIVDRLEDQYESYDVPSIQLSSSDDDFCLVVLGKDFHIGQVVYPEHTGNEMNLEIMQDRIQSLTEEILEKVDRFGEPEKIFLQLGDDWFQTGLDGKTIWGNSRDHDQDTDIVGVAGCRIARQFIDMFRQIGVPIDVIQIPGNHAGKLSNMLAENLFTAYQHQDGVNVAGKKDDLVEDVENMQYRYYDQYGNNLFGFCHGQDENKTDLYGTMSNEAAHLWEPNQFRYFFSGHTHTKEYEEGHPSGITLISSSSPAEEGDYEVRNSFIGSTQGLNSYVFYRDGGLPDNLNASVVQ